MKSIKKSILLLYSALVCGSMALGFGEDSFTKDLSLQYPAQNPFEWQEEDIMNAKPIDMGKIAESAKHVATMAKDGIITVGELTLQKGAQMTDWAADQARQGHDWVLEQAPKALKWAQDKAPEGVIAWIGNHPYVAIITAVAPICLYFGYKLGSRDQDKENRVKVSV